ncbi:hypothetical protein P154DRAFT_618968 [Amniculicola lignicola CBS 123094]|uniref:Uncharacterized protein n=1 Tax=Amniculicola lignicola CBS 123094 TaxID=1392246 RepID=A0A6A5WMA4_9PLEO|nr:hypothetical protein P154DRAFT_618968 [Amniculicola lignicola CBS 123094]
MAPPSLSHQSEPLLPPKLMNDHPETLSPTSANVLKAFSVMRVALGAALIVAPRWSCALFQLPIPAAYLVLSRLVGIRDVALGELLFTAEDKTGPDGGRREIKRALWANIATDTADVAAVAYAFAVGNMGRAPAAMLGGGGILYMLLGTVVLRGLRE